MDIISENEVYRAFWLYADRNVTVKGTEKWGRWETSWDLDLRKGWNVVYYYSYWNSDTEIGRDTFTTQKPNDVNLRWVFRSYDSYFLHSANTRTIESKRSIFRRQ